MRTAPAVLLMFLAAPLPVEAARVRWEPPVIQGALEPHALDTFWERHAATLDACIQAPTEIRLIVEGRTCTVAALQGSECLAEVLRGAALEVGYCGCGVTIVEQQLR